MHYGNKIVFGCSGSQHLTNEICGYLGNCTPGRVNFKRFTDGEIRIEIEDNVRDLDVFVVCSTQPPAENLLELILFASALRGSSAGRITLIVPYLGYNRQERKDQSRVPISAKVIAQLIAVSGADRVLLVDLHAPATAAHFEPMLVDHLYAASAVVPYLGAVFGHDQFVTATPDAGGLSRAKKYRQMTGSKGGLAVFFKERPEPGVVAEDEIIMVGDVKDKDVLFVDDIIDSAGTAIGDAEKAKEEGAKRIVFYGTHALFSNGAVKRIDESGAIDEVVVTSTIYHDPKEFEVAKNTKFTVLPIGELLGKAIRRLHNSEQLSPLFLA